MPVTEYTWDPVSDSILEETDGAGTVTASYTNEPSAYGPLISQHRDGESRFFHFDALGSTRELTDDNEDVTDSFTYDAWGNRVARTGTSEPPFQWGGHKGYLKEVATPLYSIRRRVCRTGIGLWLTSDPLFLLTQLAEYLYTSNAPVDQVDPSGLVVAGGPLSCPFNCNPTGFATIRGSLKTSPMFLHRNRNPLSYYDLDIEEIANGVGIGIGLFIDSQPANCGCDGYEFIQVVSTNLWSPGLLPPQNRPLRVDVGPDATRPFYSGNPNIDDYPASTAHLMSGAVKTLLDRPQRVWLPGIRHEPRRPMMNYEACAICVRSPINPDPNNPFVFVDPPDLVMQCVKWGFTGEFIMTPDGIDFRRARPIAPTCSSPASTTFAQALNSEFPDYRWRSC